MTLHIGSMHACIHMGAAGALDATSANLPEAKSGTNFLKKQDILTNLTKIANNDQV